MEASTREETIASHVGLVHHVARHYRGRADYEDLAQAGMLGLIQAVDNFDPLHGGAFSSYAVPMITGAIKHHLRDQGSTVRIPGRLQEQARRVAIAIEHQSQLLGRSPTIDEIATSLGMQSEEVLEALEADLARRTVSTQDEDSYLAELGGFDTDLEAVETRDSVRTALARLTALERTVVVQRFYRGRSQSQIAAGLSISQMQVSRILTRCLAQLRVELAGI